MNITATLHRTKDYVRDQVRRHIDRQVRKRLNMARGKSEMANRRALASTVKSEECLPVPRLKDLGYSPVQCDPEITGQFVSHCQFRLKETTEFKQRGYKPFFSQLFVPEDYRLDSPVMKFVLNERLLKTISTYLGCAPFLQSAELLYSRPSSGALKSSQMWHRDRHDEIVMKVFVYCHEVSAENGPFTFLPKKAGDAVPEWRFHYINDDNMRKHVPDYEVQTLLGPAGSTLLIDSFGCFHQGSRCKEPRLAAILDYDTGFGFGKRRRKWLISAEENEKLSLWQQHALGIAAQ